VLYGVYDVSKETILHPCGQKAWNMFRLCIKLGVAGGAESESRQVWLSDSPSWCPASPDVAFYGCLLLGYFYDAP
jgi:hypothetical protein